MKEWITETVPTPPDSADSTVRLRDAAVAWRMVNDEVVVLDVERSTYLGINRTGALLWQELASGATVRRLVTLVVERFDIDEEQAKRDVDAFLADLGDRNLLEEAPSA